MNKNDWGIFKLLKKYFIDTINNRNKTIELATGDYLIALDPDDYISDTLLLDIIDYCNKGVDLIKVNIELL